MTRRDYRLIAVSVAQAHSESKSSSERKGVERTMEHLAHALELDNLRFNAKKFVAFISKQLRSYAK
jgi:hypothetical protein